MAYVAPDVAAQPQESVLGATYEGPSWLGQEGFEKKTQMWIAENISNYTPQSSNTVPQVNVKTELSSQHFPQPDLQVYLVKTSLSQNEERKQQEQALTPSRKVRFAEDVKAVSIGGTVTRKKTKTEKFDWTQPEQEHKIKMAAQALEEKKKSKVEKSGSLDNIQQMLGDPVVVKEQKAEYMRLQREAMVKKDREHPKEKTALLAQTVNLDDVPKRPKLEARTKSEEVRVEARLFKGPVWVGAGSEKKFFPGGGVFLPH